MRTLLIIPALLMFALVGCASHPASSTTLVKLDTDQERDTERARTLNRKAAELISRGDYSSAESFLKKAISVDAEFGPAQNNLGVVFYNQSKLYPAAQQFLLAAALMPRDPEPRNGLGLVFESSNRFDDAISYYDRARALDPASVEYLGNSARAHLRRGDRTDELHTMLVRLAHDDPRGDWNLWARNALNRMDRSATTLPGL